MIQIDVADNKIILTGTAHRITAENDVLHIGVISGDKTIPVCVDDLDSVITCLHLAKRTLAALEEMRG